MPTAIGTKPRRLSGLAAERRCAPSAASRCGKQVVVTQGADKRRKFCSPHCERLYWKHSKNVESQPVQHSFYCRNCGVLVEIRDAKDRRTAFCSADCRKQWFSLHRNR